MLSQVPMSHPQAIIESVWECNSQDESMTDRFDSVMLFVPLISQNGKRSSLTVVRTAMMIRSLQWN